MVLFLSYTSSCNEPPHVLGYDEFEPIHDDKPLSGSGEGIRNYREKHLEKLQIVRR